MAEQRFTIEQALALGVQQHNAGNLPAAAQIYGQILNVQPNHAESLHNLGEIACRKRQYDTALQLVGKAVQLVPNHFNYYNTLAVILMALGRGDESYAAVRRSLELNPKLSNAHSNLGICYADKGDLKASIAAFEKSIELDPNNACAHDGLGLSCLMNGDLQRGWREQEWRWRKYDFTPSRYPDATHWKGEDLHGKRIFLYVEQGFGDVLQFCRYVPLLKERGAEVLFETPTELSALLKTVPGISEFIYAGQPRPVFDYACPLMSVPLWYGTTLETIPAQVPYLQPDEKLVAEWRPFFANETGLKVGIAWAGRPTHSNDLNRSTLLSTFAPLAEVPNVTFYSIQKGPAAVQAAQPPQGMKLIDLSPRLENFDVTAAIIQNLDLVISVDTVVVHLAGAMAKPVWTLLPFCPDWRWMLNRPDSPWYPTMRLFRLPKKGDWGSAMAAVKAQLGEVK